MTKTDAVLLALRIVGIAVLITAVLVGWIGFVLTLDLGLFAGLALAFGPTFLLLAAIVAIAAYRDQDADAEAAEEAV